MSDLAGRSFRRILIIKPSSPGDIIHALPVLHGLRRRFPEAHLAWLVATSFVDLIEAEVALDEVIPFDRKRFGRLGRSFVVTQEFTAFVRDLRGRRFDLVVDLQGLFRSGFLAFASGAGVRIGFAASREMAWIFYSHKIPPGDSDAHAADKNYTVARMLGFDDVPMDFTITIPEDDRQQADRLLVEAGVRPGAPYAVLVPATRWETKCWPPDRFGQLAGALKERHGLGTVFVGGGSDVEAGDVAARASNGAAKNLCGRTTLRQLAALIDGASVVVTADSTPMHMAASLGRPLVALFGPTNPSRTGPYGRLRDVLRLDLDCAPCYLRHLRQCSHGHACIQGLQVHAVLGAVEERLAQAEGAV
ncbi:MAG: glycosyltransferase family 9 protein [Phycisphaerae bacterium]|nr:glycosyltransferase family 9 protein [Phycisphaerae bacterium]